MKWAKLGEVCEIRNGYTPLKSRADFWANGSIPWFRVDDIRAGGSELNDAMQKITPAAVKKAPFKAGSLIVSTSATIGAKAIITVPFVCNQRFLSLYPCDVLDVKYLYYVLDQMQPQLERMAVSSGVFSSITQEEFAKIKIPLPGLDEQRKIAQKLDLFEALLKNLETELSQRIKQQRYYSEQLLSPDHLDDFTWHTLGDIGEFIRGNGLQKRDFTESGCPVVHYGQIYTRYGFSASETISFTSEAVFVKLRKAREGDILMATTSENFEDLGKCVVWEGAHEVGVSGDMMIFRSQQNARFLAHWFASDQFRAQKMSKITGTKVYRVHQDDMKNFKIPLPGLEKQREIARVLDLFEALIANIRTELALRSKQARYYREQLLNFTKEQK